MRPVETELDWSKNGDSWPDAFSKLDAAINALFEISPQMRAKAREWRVDTDLVRLKALAKKQGGICV